MDNIGKKRFINLEICGLIFIFLCGILLHFLYDFTEKSVIGILFGCVNNSIWEHVKVFALVYAVWGIIELAFSIPYFRQFIVSKVFGLYIQCGFMIVLISLYIIFTGNEISLMSVIPIAFVSLCISQFFSFKLTISENDIRYFFPFSLGLLFLFFVIFFCFSVVPPHIEIFKDPLTGIYGIVPKNIDVGAYFMNNMEV